MSLATIRQKILAIIVSVKINTISITISISIFFLFFFSRELFFQQDDLSLELLSNAFEVSIHSFIHSNIHSLIFFLVLSLIWGHHSKMNRQLSSICFACAYSSHNPTLGSTHTLSHSHTLRPIKLIQFTNSASLHRVGHRSTKRKPTRTCTLCKLF